MFHNPPELSDRCLCLWEIDFRPHKQDKLWSNWYLGREKEINEEIAHFNHPEDLTSETTFWLIMCVCKIKWLKTLIQ